MLDPRCYFCGEPKRSDDEIQSCKLGGDRICFNINWRTQPLQRYGLVRSMASKSSHLGVFWSMCKLFHPSSKSAHKRTLGERFLDNAVYLEDLSDEEFKLIMPTEVPERNRICYFDLVTTILETKLGYGRLAVKYSKRERDFLNWYTGLKPALQVPYYIPGSCKLCLFIPEVGSEASTFDICDRCFIHPRPTIPWLNLNDIISRDLHYRRTFRSFDWLPVDEQKQVMIKKPIKRRLEPVKTLDNGTTVWQEVESAQAEITAYLDMLDRFLTKAEKEIDELEKRTVRQLRPRKCKLHVSETGRRESKRLKKQRRQSCHLADCNSDDSA